MRDRGESNIPDTPRGEKIRELIRRADAKAFFNVPQDLYDLQSHSGAIEALQRI